jgi:hypothetical protein
MEKNQQEAMLNDIAIRTARIETHLESQKETLERIDNSLKALEPLKKDVHYHGMVIRGLIWVVGIIVSFFSLKFLGRI